MRWRVSALVRSLSLVKSMLLGPLDAILSSRSKVRLLRALLPLQESVSAREAARLARVAHPPALRALADLTAMGVLHRVELSSQHLYTVCHDNPLVRHGLLPLFEVERQRVSASFGWLRRALDAEIHCGTVRCVAIYGESARGEDSPGGTFDVLVITSSESSVPEVRRTLARLAPDLEQELALRLAPLVISRGVLREKLAAGDAALASAIAEGQMVAGESLDLLLEGAPA